MTNFTTGSIRKRYRSCRSPWLFTTRSQFLILHVIVLVAALWYVGVLGITTVAFFRALETALAAATELWAATQLSLLYAAATALLQVLVGGLLAFGIALFRRNTRLILSSVAFLPYCLQPYVVAEIWRRKKGIDLGVDEFSDLLFASVWQFAPFAMMFFLIAFESGRSQQNLVKTESSNLLSRFLQLNEIRLLKVGLALFGLRFLWMYTKFDLPFLFKPRVTDGNLLLVVEAFNQIGTGNEAVYLGGLVLSLLLAILIGAVVKLLGAARIRGLVRTPALRLAGVHISEGRWGLHLFKGTALIMIGGFLYPLLRAWYSYGPYLGESLATAISEPRLYEPILSTGLVCSSSAASAALIGGVLAYSANRVGRGLVRKGFSIVLPFVSYAVPLVILAAHAEQIRRIIQHALLNLRVPVQSVSELSDFLTAYFIYTTFCIPFAFFLLMEYVGSERERPTELLRLADGLRPGLGFQLSVVIGRNVVPLLYAAYFAFVISWQDIAVPRGLGYSLLASEFARLTDAVGEIRPEAVTTLGLALAIMLAGGYAVISARAPGGDRDG